MKGKIVIPSKESRKINVLSEDVDFLAKSVSDIMEDNDIVSESVSLVSEDSSFVAELLSVALFEIYSLKEEIAQMKGETI